MSEERKITFLQACTMMALMNGLSDHVIVNPMILDSSGRDSWITVSVAGVLFLVWSLMVVAIMRMSGMKPWRQWLRSATMPAVSWLLVAPVCAQLYLIAGMTIVHTASWHVTNYMPDSPELLLVLCLVTLTALLAIWGLRIIAITSGILLPVVIALGMLVGIGNTSQKDYKLLLPILENGWQPVWDGVVYAEAGFVELLLFVLLQHHISAKVKVWQMLAFGLFLVGIMLGPIIGGIAEFGPKEAALQMESPYEQWRLLRIGQYIEHLDFLSIFQWLSGAGVRVSLALFLLVDLLPLKSARARGWTIVGIMLSYIVVIRSPINEYDFYLWMYDYYMPISFTVLFLLSFVWMAVAAIRRPSRRGKSL
ncbi:endospore germination permease [Cohnella fermenti]|uniref:Spore gernimation protein n=1 Tax=Cohnella fermenti TaxID=2565925 RepID=A0A4S4BWJ1_9BACL|nr:endospore germination permease [Cohnella fermenti]THF79528.1 spore gernimation protein [Cohnella fermenti]